MSRRYSPSIFHVENFSLIHPLCLIYCKKDNIIVHVKSCNELFCATLNSAVSSTATVNIQEVIPKGGMTRQCRPTIYYTHNTSPSCYLHPPPPPPTTKKNTYGPIHTPYTFFNAQRIYTNHAQWNDLYLIQLPLGHQELSNASFGVAPGLHCI